MVAPLLNVSSDWDCAGRFKPPAAADIEPPKVLGQIEPGISGAWPAPPICTSGGTAASDQVASAPDMSDISEGRVQVSPWLVPPPLAAQSLAAPLALPLPTRPRAAAVDDDGACEGTKLATQVSRVAPWHKFSHNSGLHLRTKTRKHST